MNSKNRTGPRVEPCATPFVMSFISEFVPITETYCLLFKKDLINDWQNHGYHNDQA